MSRDWSRRSAFGAKADRDRKLEQALKHELRAAGTPRPDREGCVDAETLGAWADGGLNAMQMASVELHVSTCARCQAVVGATARSAPAVAVAESPFRFWKWWLAPIAATAAAVTIWMVVPEERRIAEAPPPVAAPVAPAEPSRETFAQSKDQAIPSAASSPKPAAADETLDRTQRANTPAGTRDDRRERAAEFAEKREANLGAKQDADAGKLSQDKNSFGAVAPAAAPASAPAAAELQKSGRLAFAPIEIVSPNPAIRWRIFGGALERSEDAGTTWTPLVGGGDSVTGGTAPAASICWLIGRAGLVMVTADGVTFARVPLPERVDLTGITATDARTATVTTADGRRFRTDDSGRNWRQN